MKSVSELEIILKILIIVISKWINQSIVILIIKII